MKNSVFGTKQAEKNFVVFAAIPLEAASLLRKSLYGMLQRIKNLTARTAATSYEPPANPKPKPRRTHGGLAAHHGGLAAQRKSVCILVNVGKTSSHAATPLPFHLTALESAENR